MTSEEIAAWVQAIGSIAAIAATGYFIHYEKKLDRRERDEENKVRALGLAAELDMVLMRISGRIIFEPLGDDTDAMTTDEAYSSMRLEDEQLDALRLASREAYLFGSPTADEIILLSLDAARYQGFVRNWAGKMDHDAQLFLERIRPSCDELSGRVERVRALLQEFLPKEAREIPGLHEDGEP